MDDRALDSPYGALQNMKGVCYILTWLKTAQILVVFQLEKNTVFGSKRSGLVRSPFVFDPTSSDFGSRPKNFQFEFEEIS